jgi:hypothetical protein
LFYSNASGDDEMGSSETRILMAGFGRVSHWAGRSGRLYDLVSESPDRFRMGDGELYLIAKGHAVLWVGSRNELVNDAMSRTRFRLALDCADRAFRLAARESEGQHASVIWDLEGGEPALEAQAA